MKSFALTLGLAVALLYVLASQWTAQRTREFLTALLAALLACSLCACATHPPAPVSVSRLSVSPALSAARDVSGASDRIADGVARQQGAIARQGSAIDRQRVLIERARRLIDGKTIVP